jgi:hypothetical protein
LIAPWAIGTLSDGVTNLVVVRLKIVSWDCCPYVTQIYVSTEYVCWLIRARATLFVEASLKPSLRGKMKKKISTLSSW